MGRSTQSLEQAIIERLQAVIDPETGVDVVRMRLIEDLTVDAGGHVTYKFRPSSALCPLAVPLALHIQQAVAEVEGVTGHASRRLHPCRGADGAHEAHARRLTSTTPC